MRGVRRRWNADMRDIRIRRRDGWLLVLVSLPLASATTFLVFWASNPPAHTYGPYFPRLLTLAIIGAFFGPVASIGGWGGYWISRGLQIARPWVFVGVIALSSALFLIVLRYALASIDMQGFVSESFNGVPSNPYMDANDQALSLFLMAFVPAALASGFVVAYRITHPATATAIVAEIATTE